MRIEIENNHFLLSFYRFLEYVFRKHQLTPFAVIVIFFRSIRREIAYYL